MKNILCKYRDEAYKKFQSALIPTLSPERMIGVRTPHLRSLASKYKNTKERETFMKSLPHTFYEENNLHVFFISQILDYDECIRELEFFLPYVDNWATCDSIRPVCFKSNKGRLTEDVKRWISSDHPYIKRFAIEMLMVHFLDDDFDDSYPHMVSLIKSDEYYVNMMIAWYFATALSKRWEVIFPYIKEKKLPLWIHNKTIRKAIESNRVSDLQKDLLRRERIMR